MRHENKTDLRKAKGLEVVESLLRTKQHGETLSRKKGECDIFSVNLGRHEIVHTDEDRETKTLRVD